MDDRLSPLERDPVIEAYKQAVDRTLLRERLKRTPTERLDDLAALAAFADGRVDFILVGGVAATIHGSARLTRDVDVVYARTDDNLARLVAAPGPLSPYPRGAPPGLPFSFDVETLRRGLNFTLTTLGTSPDRPITVPDRT